MDARMGANINGPSLIRVPDWVDNPLGKYYLYFAHHQGKYIRLAHADDLDGPWKIHEPGVLALENAYCVSHVASPDVHILDDLREIRMYYHGPVPKKVQQAKVARSQDGLNFTAKPEDLGNSYFRVFRWKEYTYALGMPGIFYRSRDDSKRCRWNSHRRHYFEAFFWGNSNCFDRYFGIKFGIWRRVEAPRRF